MKARMRAGTFSVAEEFPAFRDLHMVVDPSQLRTCGQVFDEFLGYIERRVARHELSATTLTGYRRILDTIWRPPSLSLRPE